MGQIKKDYLGSPLKWRATCRMHECREAQGCAIAAPERLTCRLRRLPRAPHHLRRCALHLKDPIPGACLYRVAPGLRRTWTPNRISQPPDIRKDNGRANGFDSLGQRFMAKALRKKISTSLHRTRFARKGGERRQRRTRHELPGPGSRELTERRYRRKVTVIRPADGLKNLK